MHKICKVRGSNPSHHHKKDGGFGFSNSLFYTFLSISALIYFLSHIFPSNLNITISPTFPTKKIEGFFIFVSTQNVALERHSWKAQTLWMNELAAKQFGCKQV